MSLLPRWYNRLTSPGGGLSKFFENLDEGLTQFTHPSGLSVYSDEKNVYIEADVPGLTAKDVQVSLDPDGVLWIKGEKKIEEKNKNKKFYHRSVQAFSYAIPLGDEIDKHAEPQATCKDGVMKIVFPKKKDKQSVGKKIQVREEK